MLRRERRTSRRSACILFIQSFPSESDPLAPTTVHLPVPLLFRWNFTLQSRRQPSYPFHFFSVGILPPGCFTCQTLASRRGESHSLSHGRIRSSESLYPDSPLVMVLAQPSSTVVALPVGLPSSTEIHVSRLSMRTPTETQLPVFGADFTETWNQQRVNASSSISG